MNSAVPPEVDSEAGVSTGPAVVAVPLPYRPSLVPLGRPVSAIRPGPWLLSPCTYMCC